MWNASEINSETACCLSVPADLQQLARLRTSVRQTCKASMVEHLDDDFLGPQIAQLELAVTELVSNVIRYGHEGVPGGELNLSMAVNCGVFEMELIHKGHPFDGNAVEIPDITEPQEGGMGLYLIAECVDEVTYGTTPDGCNQILLSKTFSLA